MSFTNIINNFLNVRNKVFDSELNEWVDQVKTIEERVGYNALESQVSTEDELVIFNDFGNKIILDKFSYSCNSPIYPVLHAKEGNTSLYSNTQLFLNTTLNGRSGAIPSVINSHGNEFLEVQNTSSDRHVVVLKKPIILPEGGRLAFRALGSSSGGTVTYHVSYIKVVD